MSTGDHLSTPSECKFELNEYDEVCDTGGEHAGEGPAGDGEVATGRDGPHLGQSHDQVVQLLPLQL